MKPHGASPRSRREERHRIRRFYNANPEPWALTPQQPPPARPEPEDCSHDHVEKDDDGRDYWFWVCSDCDAIVVPEQNEDGGTDWTTFDG